MNNIIIFKTYNLRKGDIMRPEELLYKLKEQNKMNHEYSLDEIRELTKQILSMASYYSGRCATPIVKIAKIFEFQTYKKMLNESGDININGDTFNIYGHDKVILVNKNEELFHQRFVIAHELAHYLFDFLGNSKYEDPKIKFAEPYKKDNHDTPQERRANTFAAEIMMPKELFIKQYNIAVNENSSNMFVLIYLSKYFETSMDSIEKRIWEVSK